MVHYFSGSDLNWLSEVGNLETPSEDLYKDLLEAAFGNPSGGAAYEIEEPHDALQIEHSFLNVSSLLHIWAPAYRLRYRTFD